MKVKICGITRSEDVQLCEENNADFMGFINIKRSARYVNLEKISQLSSSLEDKNKAVLVLEVKNVEEALNAIEHLGISTIQLHSLNSEEIKNLSINNPLNTSLRVIKAVGIPGAIDALKKSEIENYARVSDYLLFDSQVNGKTGGTGKQISIDQIVKGSEIAKASNKNIKLILAGGINLHYIKKEGHLLESIFDMVDVNSGVEDLPRLKNPNKVMEFMQYLKNIDES
jgi:phosphoribosylanthranilate isomerase